MPEAADGLALLRDTILPVETDAAILADWAMAGAFGLLAAILVSILARLVLTHRDSANRQEMAALIASRKLEAAERMLAQVRILHGMALRLDAGSDAAAGAHWLARLGRHLGTDFFTAGSGADLAEDLYRKNPSIDPDRLDREMVGLIKRAGGRRSW